MEVAGLQEMDRHADRDIGLADPHRCQGGTPATAAENGLWNPSGMSLPRWGSGRRVVHRPRDVNHYSGRRMGDGAVGMSIGWDLEGTKVAASFKANSG